MYVYVRTCVTRTKEGDRQRVKGFPQRDVRIGSELRANHYHRTITSQYMHRIEALKMHHIIFPGYPYHVLWAFSAVQTISDCMETPESSISYD